MRMLRRVATFAALALVGPLLTLPAQTVGAATSIPSGVVNPVPAAFPPTITDGKVQAFAQVGDTMVVGGTFTSVTPKSGSALTRRYIFAFNAKTGDMVTGFAPVLDGEVIALEPGPDGKSVYVGGGFNNVNGAKSKSLALLSLSTGTAVASFKVPAVNGNVNTVKLAGGRLYIGGIFSKVSNADHAGLATLNPTTGALDPFMNVQVAGHHNYTGQPGEASAGVGVKRLDVTPDASRLVAIGNFKTADGLPRDQIVVVDLGGQSATVANWATSGFTGRCYYWAFDTYMRDMEISPDGSFFVVGTSGGANSGTLCDSMTRWPTFATGTNIQPTWADFAGGDSIYSVAITNSAIYGAGHPRWMNNTYGHDSAGGGAVPRAGIVALDPDTGLPLSWNPGRNPRGACGCAMLATSDGLWVGSETDWIGNRTYKRGRMAFFPFAGGKQIPTYSTGSLPADIYLAGRLATTADTGVLYRVNAGGGAIRSLDSGPDWAADNSDPSPYRTGASNPAGWDPGAKLDSTIPSSTPSAIFDSERWGPDANDEMQWQFPVPQGTKVDVRLYFANRCGCTSQAGQRAFSVAIDGQTVLTNYDIVANVGDQTGTMKTFTDTSTGTITIRLMHNVENPLINGIEIVRTGSTPPPPSTSNVLYRVNGGGPGIQSLDSGPDWAADDSDPSPYRTGASNPAGWDPGAKLDSTIPSSTPSAIFDSERWGPDANNEMQWQFPVAQGTQVDVRLYFGNRCGCTSQVGQRVFNVAINGTTVLNNYDIVANVGDQTGTMKKFTVTSTGTITIRLTHKVENPLINGIEIVRAGSQSPPPPAGSDDVRYIHYDGTTAAPATTMPDTGISWHSARGAMMINNILYYGWTDSNLYKRTFNGVTFGPATLIDPYNDPVWSNVATGSGDTYRGAKPSFYSELPNVTAMFYTNGTVYYTLYGQTAMYYRAFLPESDIVGAQEYKVSDGKNWSDTAGMFLSDNALYFASRSTGNLSRITFTGGKAVGAATPVSGPLIDGTDWRSRAMFLTGGQSSAPPPVASFTSSCQLLNCAFDSSASTAPGGQIASYAWNFGDGSTSTQANPSHSFAQAGSYGVTLTVKDNRGSTGSASATVTVSTTQSQSISFVAKASTTGNSRTYSVTIPASVKAGNGLLLLLAANSASTVGDPTGLTGWQRVDTIVQRGITSIVWQKVAGASDASKMVTIDLGDTHKATLQVLVYSGTNAAGPVAGYAVDSDNAVTDHTTPKASVTSTGSWALSYWADKSSSTTAWTAPAGQATRDVIYGTGSGRITALVTDSGGPVAVGTYGGLTASTDAASTAIRWTLVLRAGG